MIIFLIDVSGMMLKDNNCPSYFNGHRISKMIIVLFVLMPIGFQKKIPIGFIAVGSSIIIALVGLMAIGLLWY